MQKAPSKHRWGLPFNKSESTFFPVEKLESKLSNSIYSVNKQNKNLKLCHFKVYILVSL